MIPLLRDVVVRAMAARHASERELVECRALEFGAIAFACGRVCGGGFLLRELARRTGDGVGETKL